jgi:putative peptidoglycan lipid II flippase
MPASSNSSTARSSSARASAPLRAAAVLSLLYFLARFIGLFQAALITAILPPFAADAYKRAFALPNFLNYMVAGGALSLTFIPTFGGLWDKGKEAQAWRFYSALASLMSFVLVALTLLLVAFAPTIVALSNPDLTIKGKENTLALTVAMTRVMLPAQLFFYLGGLFAAVLNTFKRFSASGWTGAVYNIVAILVAVPMWYGSKNPLSFAIGITLGALVGNFVLPLWALLSGPRAQRPRFSFQLDFQNPSVRRFFRLAIPIMLGVSFPVVDMMIVQYFTPGEFGRFAHIDNANRLMIAAQGLLGQAAAVAALPFLASKVASGDYTAFSDFLRSGLRRLLFITLPVSILLILWAHPVVSLVFGWGVFNRPYKIEETAQCFAFFSVGLFAWGAQGLVARGFYALGDTRTPTIYGSILTLLFIALCAFLKHAGLEGGALLSAFSLATSVGAAGQFVGLLILLERRLKQPRFNAPIDLERVAGTLVRTSVACLLMGVAGLLALLLAQPFIGQSKIEQLLLLLWTGTVAVFVFVSAANRFEIPEWLWLRDKFTRRSAR